MYFNAKVYYEKKNTIEPWSSWKTHLVSWRPSQHATDTDDRPESRQSRIRAGDKSGILLATTAKGGWRCWRVCHVDHICGWVWRKKELFIRTGTTWTMIEVAFESSSAHAWVLWICWAYWNMLLAAYCGPYMFSHLRMPAELVNHHLSIDTAPDITCKGCKSRIVFVPN